MENIVLDLFFKILISAAALIVIAQFGKFQPPFECYYLWRLITLSESKISDDLCETDSFNEMFRVSRIIYSLNGVYKKLSLVNSKSTAIGFYNHLNTDARVAKKDLFKSIKRDIKFRVGINKSKNINQLFISLSDKFPSVLTAKHIYLIQSIILCRLGIKVTDEVLKTCFDLAIDENEKVFKYDEYKWDKFKVLTLSNILYQFSEQNNPIKFGDMIYDEIILGNTGTQYFRMQSKFIELVRSEE